MTLHTKKALNVIIRNAIGLTYKGILHFSLAIQQQVSSQKYHIIAFIYKTA